MTGGAVMTVSALDSLAAQMRRLPLTVTPGSRGFRCAWIGGPIYWAADDPITGDTLWFATDDAAYAAFKAANGALLALDELLGRIAI